MAQGVTGLSHCGQTWCALSLTGERPAWMTQRFQPWWFSQQNECARRVDRARNRNVPQHIGIQQGKNTSTRRTCGQNWEWHITRKKFWSTFGKQTWLAGKSTILIRCWNPYCLKSLENKQQWPATMAASLIYPISLSIDLSIYTNAGHLPNLCVNITLSILCAYTPAVVTSHWRCDIGQSPLKFDDLLLQTITPQINTSRYTHTYIYIPISISIYI